MTDTVERLKSEFLQWSRYGSVFSRPSTRTPDERIDSSSFTKDDLGLRLISVVEPGYDHAGYGEDIQRQVDRYDQPEKRKLEKRSEFLERVLGRGYYNYAKFRKIIGSPLESFNLTWWNFGYYSSLLQMVNPGGLIFTREGTYNVGKDGGTSSVNVNGHPIKLKSNIAFEGTGFATILKMKDYQQKVGNNITDVPNTQGVPSIITTNDWSGLGVNSNILIHNLQLDGNRVNQNQVSPNNTEHDPINLAGVKQALIEAVYVHDAYSDGFDLDYCEATTVRDCWAKDCGGSGFHPSDGGGTSFKPIAATGGRRITLVGCVAEGGGDLLPRGSFLDSTGGTFAHNRFMACHSYNSLDYGFSFASRYSMAIGCSVDNAAFQGFRTDTGNTRSFFYHCSASQCGRSGFYIGKDGNFAYTHIEGCVSEDNGDAEAANDQDGIHLEVTVDSIIIGNLCRDTRAGAARTQQNGIKEYGASDRNIIGLNRVTNNETDQIVTVGVNTITPNNIVT